jgi:hypothetical protein
MYKVVYGTAHPCLSAVLMGHSPKAMLEHYSCCFCQEAFEDGMRVVSLSCGHKFHSKQQMEDKPICMDHWAFISEINGHSPWNYCPICITIISGAR